MSAHAHPPLGWLFLRVGDLRPCGADSSAGGSGVYRLGPTRQLTTTLSLPAVKRQPAAGRSAVAGLSWYASGHQAF
jgi:hypothetical protein